MLRPTIEVQVQSLQRYVHPSQVVSQSQANNKMGYRSEPSLNLLPQFHGVSLPSFSFCIKTTGFMIPGTAAEARRALHMTVSGVVR